MRTAAEPDEYVVSYSYRDKRAINGRSETEYPSQEGDGGERA